MERLVSIVQELSLVRTLDALVATVRSAARELTGADGATFVLRDRDWCHYVDEDAISPLWKGRRFPLERCISGWSMLHRQPVVIEDIYADPRIPVDVYRPTFVKSLVMVPIRTVDPVGAIGNYWARPHRASDDEVKLLCALADSTSIAMENVQLYAGLERRVEERTAALATSQAELAAKHETLLRERRSRDELATLIVHDLKGPAAGIVMTSQARLRNATLAEPERRAWTMVHSAAETVNRLALNILDVSRSEDGALTVARQDVSLRELLEDVVQSMSALAEGRGQGVALSVDPASGGVQGDPELLRRVVQNLIDNGVRHGPSGGTLRVSARRTDDETVEILVADEGRGIPAAVRESIFEKYARVDATDTRNATGRGLGLTFCRLAVEAHGGRISVHDNMPAGSVFRVQLPAPPLR